MATDPLPQRTPTLLDIGSNLAGPSIIPSKTSVNTAAVSPDNYAQPEIYTNITQTFEVTAAVQTAYPTPIPVATGPTVPGNPSATDTKPELIAPPAEDVIQSESAYYSLDNAMFSGAVDSVASETRMAIYDSSVRALSPIGSTLAGSATGIVGLINAVGNTLTSTLNKAVGAITDVLSGKLLTSAVSGLMTTAEKMAAMVGQAAYQNVMGFLEGFKTIGNILNSAANIASDIGQTVKKAAQDIGSVLSQDWDKLSWPDINFGRIKSLLDTESFTKLGTAVGSFVGNVKLPIGLSINQIADLTKNLDLKEQLLKQVADAKAGVTKLGTEALNALYSQLAAVNNAISALTNLNPSSLTSMANNLFGRVDPLKERAAVKTIADLIKEAGVAKSGDEEEGGGESAPKPKTAVQSPKNINVINSEIPPTVARDEFLGLPAPEDAPPVIGENFGQPTIENAAIPPTVTNQDFSTDQNSNSRNADPAPISSTSVGKTADQLWQEYLAKQKK